MHHETSILYGPVNALLGKLGVHLPDHVIMALLVLLVSLIVFPLITRNLSKDDPGPLQQMLELLVEGLKNLLEDVVGHGAANKFLYGIGAFTVFIFISNIFGLFYFLQPPTGNVNTTFALAISSFLYFNWQGIRAQGPGHYLLHFMGPVWWLAPLMFLIEMIGNFARILSLGMRLFGNITGEHTATGIFMGLFPLVIPWAMMALGIFGAVLQTFVFIMLTMVYVGGAVTAEEH
ncbi:MAG TPA: F0F1 ATP synthase subunit A [Thermoanaerobaculia bacterium]